MSHTELNQAILKVSEATDQTVEQVAEKLYNKDGWTWFLIEQANK